MSAEKGRARGRVAWPVPPYEVAGTTGRPATPVVVHDRTAVHPKRGRNEPCWCGSGRKYKRCHLDADMGR